MKKEITIDELINKADIVKNFVLAKGLDSIQLIELATNLKDKKNKNVKIYWLDGEETLYYPTFESIRMRPRFIVKQREICSSTDGLIFPQSEPIILLIANFNKLTKEDQEKFVNCLCRKEEHDYYPHYYLHPESVVILGIPQSYEIPKISYKLQVRILI